MALTVPTAGEMRRRAFLAYGEVAGGGEFATATMNTFMNRAVTRFALDSGIVVGSCRTARPTHTTTAPAESLVILPAGLFDPRRVVHERRAYGGVAYLTDVRHATQKSLALTYGSSWAYAKGSDVGVAPTTMRWYRKGSQIVGLFPCNMTGHTAGTAVIWCSKVPDAITHDTAPLTIPAEYADGIISDVCRQMAERDVDSDAEGKRAAAFEAETAVWIQRARAQVYQTWDVED